MSLELDGGAFLSGLTLKVISLSQGLNGLFYKCVLSADVGDLGTLARSPVALCSKFVSESVNRAP